MRVRNSLSVAGMASAALGLGLTLSSCVADTGHTSSNLQCTSDFGATAEAVRLESFLRAAGEFHGAALDAEADLRTSCHDMGIALGMSDAEIFVGATSHEGTVGLRAACTNVKTRIDGELTAIRAAGAIQVTLDVRPPHCDVSVNAYASCAAECDARVDPGTVEIMCRGGEIRGACDATCSGECAVNVDVACSGRCEGRCEGTCAARDADGACNGACAGTCHGQCVVSSSAACMAECRGTCSVRFREPRCTGDVQAPMVMASCAADCDARVAAMATCTHGEVHLAVVGTLDTTLRARADRLIAAFAVGASGMYELRARAAILSTSGSVLVSTASSVPADASAIGAVAVACATASAAQVADAASSLSVSVDVSVSVSGSISGSAR